MIIKAWEPLFSLLALAGAGVVGLFMEHPEPNSRSQPTVTPYKNAQQRELAATHSSNQHDEKGEQESNWGKRLFEKPTDTCLSSSTGFWSSLQVSSIAQQQVCSLKQQGCEPLLTNKLRSGCIRGRLSADYPPHRGIMAQALSVVATLRTPTPPCSCPLSFMASANSLPVQCS
jgi:hypothetical protein